MFLNTRQTALSGSIIECFDATGCLRRQKLNIRERHIQLTVFSLGKPRVIFGKVLPGQYGVGQLRTVSAGNTLMKGGYAPRTVLAQVQISIFLPSNMACLEHAQQARGRSVTSASHRFWRRRSVGRHTATRDGSSHRIGRRRIRPRRSSRASKKQIPVKLNQCHTITLHTI